MREEKIDGGKRRSFVKGMFFGALGIYGLKAGGTSQGEVQESRHKHLDNGGEILYRETEEFRRYYDSLRD